MLCFYSHRSEGDGREGDESEGDGSEGDRREDVWREGNRNAMVGKGGRLIGERERMITVCQVTRLQGYIM